MCGDLFFGFFGKIMIFLVSNFDSNNSIGGLAATLKNKSSNMTSI